MESVIDFHEKECEPLQRLLKDAALTIEKVIEILNYKIDKITAEISDDIERVHEDLDQLQFLVKQNLMQRSTDGESEELFSNLRVVKCWE